jgi:hypothetical protein
MLAICFLVVSYMAYYSNLKMEGINSSSTWVNVYRIPRKYKPEDGAFQFEFSFEHQRD